MKDQRALTESAAALDARINEGSITRQY
jgi:hypothetical protein